MAAVAQKLVEAGWTYHPLHAVLKCPKCDGWLSMTAVERCVSHGVDPNRLHACAKTTEALNYTSSAFGRVVVRRGSGNEGLELKCPDDLERHLQGLASRGERLIGYIEVILHETAWPLFVGCIDSMAVFSQHGGTRLCMAGSALIDGFMHHCKMPHGHKGECDWAARKLTDEQLRAEYERRMPVKNGQRGASNGEWTYFWVSDAAYRILGKTRLDGLHADELEARVTELLKAEADLKALRAMKCLMVDVDNLPVGHLQTVGRVELLVTRVDDVSLPGRDLLVTRGGCAICGAPAGTPCTKECDTDTVPDESVKRASLTVEHTPDSGRGIAELELRAPVKPPQHVAVLDEASLADLLADDAPPGWKPKEPTS